MKTAARLLALLLPLAALAQEEGFTPLFDGKTLDGWVNVNCAPETWSVRDGMIHCEGTPTGAMRTEKQYENFILELEWRHLKAGSNAGIFIWASPLPAVGVPFLRSIEVQVLDHGYGNTDSHTTHGDVFAIHGASMKPFPPSKGMRSFPTEKRSKPSPEWNHYRITCQDGTIRLAVNGKEVSGGSDCVWRKGYIGLESEGGPVDWRNLRIKELPASGATAEQTAPLAEPWQNLYDGRSLRGWKTTTPDRWQPSDWRLALKAGEPGKPLWTEAEFGDCEFIVDVKVPGKSPTDFALLLRGSESAGTTVSLGELMPRGTIDAQEEGIKRGEWNRVNVKVKGRAVTLAINGREIRRQELPADAPARGPIGLVDIGTKMECANFFVK